MTKTYKIGDSGSTVGLIQQSLNHFNMGVRANGEELAIDNIFGVKTRNAVIEFQRAYNLPTTGVFSQMEADTSKVHWSDSVYDLGDVEIIGESSSGGLWFLLAAAAVVWGAS